MDDPQHGSVRADQVAAAWLGRLTPARVGLRLGLVALLCAFGWSLWAQYRWMSEASTSSAVVFREAVDGRLAAIADEVDRRFTSDMLRSLDGPASALLPESDDDDVATFFANAPAEGVRAYYLFSLRADRRLKVTLYDPATRSAVPGARYPEFGAARNGSLEWMYLLEERGRADPSRIAVFAASPESLVVSRPVVAADSSAVGVAGAVMDSAYLRNVYLPHAVVAATSAQAQGSSLERASIAVLDADGAKVYATEEAPDRSPEAAATLRFPFPNWRLTATELGETPEDSARRRFALGLFQIVSCGALLAAGAVLALRGSALEVRALRMKADFVSNMTHELQSPLTSIRLNAELLRSGRLAGREAIEECGTHIERESERLGRLVNNVLDFARIDAGRKAYRFREADLAAIVRGVLDASYVRVEHAGLYLDVDLPRESPLPIVADPEAVAQAVSNLLDNAIKWSTAPATISVRCSSTATTATVEIEDAGPGIARDQQRRIFERFYRVHTGLRHDVKGSGIGLAIVKHVADAHRATIEVDSEPGRGSRFGLTFPSSEGGAGKAPGVRPCAPVTTTREDTDDDAPHRRG